MLSLLVFLLTSLELFSQAINTTEYNNLVRVAKKENKIIILLFGADWCVPCKNIITEVNTNNNKFMSLYNNCYYFYVDIDHYDSKEFLERFSVTAVPSTIIFRPKSGEFVLKQGSLSMNNLEQAVKKIIQSK